MRPTVSFSSDVIDESVIDLTTPGLLRAARALAQVDARTLARRAQVGLITIKRIESGTAGRVRRTTQVSLATALLKLGVEVVAAGGGGGPGVRLTGQRPDDARV